ncbi:MAG: hypothetical protein M1820_006915 [Bogoriella megaspora]|nr:MAG: hypothetical protein M1820_006915 [Bogoriella megaspora]
MAAAAAVTVPPREGEEAVEGWLDKNALKIHAGLTLPISYRSQREILTEESQAERWTEDFKEIMRQYQRIAKKKQRPPRYKVDDTHTWAEVMQVCQEAETKYVADGKRLIPRFLRWAGDHQASLKLWVGLLPNDKYFNTLCGGLKLILGAAAERSQKRGMILDAMEKVPDTVLETAEWEHLFHSDQTLQNLALGVYLALLQLIESLIAELVDRSTWEKIKHAAMGKRKSARGRTGDPPLEQTKGDCEARMQALRNHVEQLRAKSALQTEVKVLEVDDEAKTILEKQKVSIKVMNEIKSMLHDNLQKTRWATRVIENFERQQRKGEQLLEANERLLARMGNMQSPTLPTTIEVQELLEMLRPFIASPEDDIQDVQSSALEKDSDFQCRATWLSHEDQFQQWLQSPESSLLAVDGNTEAYEAEAYSPMSLFCSLLMESLQKKPGADVIGFFCGSHAEPSDETCGPEGLIVSLIAQLLQNYRFDFGFINSAGWYEQLERRDPRQLLKLLRELVQQLPPTVLFCLVDGVSLYEVGPWGDSTKALIAELQDMTDGRDLNIVLKVLLTSGGVSRLASRMVGSDYYVWVPADTRTEGFVDFEGDHRGSWN